MADSNENNLIDPILATRPIRPARSVTRPTQPSETPKPSIHQESEINDWGIESPFPRNDDPTKLHLEADPPTQKINMEQIMKTQRPTTLPE